MASNGGPESFAPETILAAMTTMRGGEPDKKKAAMDYLGKFQKSVGNSLPHWQRLIGWTLGKLMRPTAKCLDDDPHDPPIEHRGRSHTVRSDNVEGKGTLKRRHTSQPAQQNSD